MKPVNQKLATNYFGIVAAGGSGARLNPETPKQYLEINKRSILEISVGTLLNSVNFKKLRRAMKTFIIMDKSFMGQLSGKLEEAGIPS